MLIGQIISTRVVYGKTMEMLIGTFVVYRKTTMMHLVGFEATDILGTSTIRTPSKVVSGPFWPAESNCNIHLSIALLVVARLARTSSPQRKIPSTHLHLRCNSSQLPSEFREREFLDLFDALNLLVSSVCPWDHWLLWYKRKYLHFLRVKNSARFFHHPLPPVLTTIRISSKVVSRPLGCAECACSTIHLSIAALIVE